MDGSRRPCTGTSQSRSPFVTEAARAPARTPAASGSGRCWCCSPPRPGARPDVDDVVTAACVVEITHVGSLYHDDVMDEAALRRGRGLGQRPLGQPGRHPHRRLPLRQVLRADRPAGRGRRPDPGARPSPASSRARSWRPCRPGPDEDPLEHYLDVVAGKTGSLIATSARYGARFGGATPEVEEALAAYGEIVGSRLPALRRHPRRRLGLRSSPARPPAPTCARACPRCRC